MQKTILFIASTPLHLCQKTYFIYQKKFIYFLFFLGDPYLNNALNGLVEIFAYIAMFAAILWGRVPTLAGGFIFAGLFCIASMLCDIYSDNLTGNIIFRKIYYYSIYEVLGKNC